MLYFPVPAEVKTTSIIKKIKDRCPSKTKRVIFHFTFSSRSDVRDRTSHLCYSLLSRRVISRGDWMSLRVPSPGSAPPRRSHCASWQQVAARASLPPSDAATGVPNLSLVPGVAREPSKADVPSTAPSWWGSGRLRPSAWVHERSGARRHGRRGRSPRAKARVAHEQTMAQGPRPPRSATPAPFVEEHPFEVSQAPPRREATIRRPRHLRHPRAPPPRSHRVHDVACPPS